MQIICKEFTRVLRMWPFVKRMATAYFRSGHECSRMAPNDQGEQVSKKLAANMYRTLSGTDHSE